MGFLLINKKHFGQGYNENLKPIWGYEDEDLYNRVLQQKIEVKNWWQEFKSLQRVIFFDIERYITHIPHDDELRFIHSAGQNSRDFRQNITISRKQPIWQHQKYECLYESKNYIKYKRTYENLR